MRSPVAPGPSWTTVRASTLNADSNGFLGYTVRQRIDAAGLADIAGSQLRFSFGASTAGPLTFAKAYVQIEGATDYQFASAPVPITFDGGSASVSMTSNSTKTSDAIAFAYDGLSDLVVSLYSSGQGNYRCKTTNANGAAKYKAGDDAITQASTGYATQAGLADVLALIEVS